MKSDTWMERFIEITDEESWPPRVRALLSIGLVIWVFFVAWLFLALERS